MDFKVAGTAEFVTALQLDTKIDGLPAEVLAKALTQAREARLTILAVIERAIAGPRPTVNDNAPKIVAFEIPLDKIGEVIGPKGKVINALQQETGADINVDDDGTVGTVTIGAKDGLAVEEARRRIELILDPPSAEVGHVYPGKVVNITKFGAFVNILPGRDGLVHISRLGAGKRVERVEDVVSLGQDLQVIVDDIDPQGKVSLSIVDESGERLGGGSPAAEREPRRERSHHDEPAHGDSAPHAEQEGEQGPVRRVSFEDAFAADLRADYGDLGPEPLTAARATNGGEDRARRRRRR
jgi:polyribonucleotide nucleotidyltransferase